MVGEDFFKEGFSMVVAIFSPGLAMRHCCCLLL